MRKIFAALLVACLFHIGAAHAGFPEPAGAPTTVVPGNITIAVFAAAQPVDGKEFVGVFQLQTDGTFNYTGLGTSPSATLASDVAAAGGYQAYLQTVALPLINTDIASVYYGSSSTAPTPPAPGSDVTAFLNYSLATQFAFKSVNGVQVLGGK